MTETRTWEGGQARCRYSDDEVAEGRRLVATLDQSQWALGDLAVRVAGPAGATRAHDGSYGLLSEFAELIGLTGEQLSRYRVVATAWPAGERVEGASWTLHRTVSPSETRHAELSGFIALARREHFSPTHRRLLEYLGRSPARAGEEDAGEVVVPQPPEWTKRPVPTHIRVPATIEAAVQRLTELSEELFELRQWWVEMLDMFIEHPRLLNSARDLGDQIALNLKIDPWDRLEDLDEDDWASKDHLLDVRRVLAAFELTRVRWAREQEKR